MGRLVGGERLVCVLRMDLRSVALTRKQWEESGWFAS